MPRDSLTVCLCGIPDEAGASIDEQLDVHAELGWRLVELRSVDGISICAMPDDRFAEVAAAVAQSGMRVAALDTGIGGWDRPIDGPAHRDWEELAVAADRAHRLGTRFLRVMSSPNAGLTATAWGDRALDRLASLVGRASTLDVVLLHENCQGWASQSASNTTRMLRTIDSPHLRLLFDTGNPLVYGQDALSFVYTVAPWVEHVHVKDVRRSGNSLDFTFPGQGDAQVHLCVDALFRTGYHGAFSIEPHLACVPHLGIGLPPEARRRAYVEYGHRFRRLLVELLDPEGRI